MTVAQTTPAVLDRIARELPEHQALVTAEKTLTYAQLRAEVRRAAAAMIDLGVAAGDRVAIWSPTPGTGWWPAWPRTTPVPSWSR